MPLVCKVVGVGPVGQATCVHLVSLWLVHSEAEIQKMWPCYDPPIGAWIEIGKMTPYMETSLLHVTQHASGWLSYLPAHAGLERYLFNHNRKFRSVAKPTQLAILHAIYGLPSPYSCLDSIAVQFVTGWWMVPTGSTSHLEADLAPWSTWWAGCYFWRQYHIYLWPLGCNSFYWSLVAPLVPSPPIVAKF